MVHVEENDMEHAVEKSAQQRQEKGFTLIETATALLVMMIGGLGICAVFTYAIKNNTGSRDRACPTASADSRHQTLSARENESAGSALAFRAR